MSPSLSAGRLLPTGNVMDELKLDTGESYRFTIVDAGNPTAFVRAEELKLRGNELPAEFDQDMARRAKLEAIRKKVGEMVGIPVSQSIPKIPFIAADRVDALIETVERLELLDDIRELTRLLA